MVVWAVGRYLICLLLAEQVGKVVVLSRYSREVYFVLNCNIVNDD